MLIWKQFCEQLTFTYFVLIICLYILQLHHIVEAFERSEDSNTKINKISFTQMDSLVSSPVWDRLRFATETDLDISKRSRFIIGNWQTNETSTLHRSFAIGEFSSRRKTSLMQYSSIILWNWDSSYWIVWLG